VPHILMRRTETNYKSARSRDTFNLVLKLRCY